LDAFSTAKPWVKNVLLSDFDRVDAVANGDDSPANFMTESRPMTCHTAKKWFGEVEVMIEKGWGDPEISSGLAMMVVLISRASSGGRI
jgi:hypothetical protein